MNESQNEEIGYLIELAITGQANADQFDQVMSRVENEPEVAELYQQCLAEHGLLEEHMEAMLQKIAQDQAKEAERLRQEALAEKQRLELENDLELGM